MSNDTSPQGVMADLDAERHTIGAMMFDPGCIPEVCLVLGGVSAVFGQARNQLIYAAVVEMVAEGRPVDLHTLATQLSRRGELSQVGGVAYLYEIQESVPSAANAEYYAGEVRQNYERRLYYQGGGELAAMAVEGRPLDYMQGYVQETLAQIGTPAIPTDSTIGALMEAVIEEIHNPTEEGRTPTKPEVLADKVPYLNAGDMVIVAGATSVGKSALAMNIAWKTCYPKRMPVVYITLEMTEMQVSQRILAMLSGVSLGRITNPKALSGEDHKRLAGVMETVEAMPFHIVYNSGMGIEEAQNIARAYAKKHGQLGCIVLDYLQYMRSDTSDSRHEEVAKYSVRMKSLAGELKTPCIVVSQLNRGVSSAAAPELNHLRESGALEQDSDVVMMIGAPGRDEEGRAYPDSSVYIRKNRQGETGTVEMTFSAPRMRWE